MLKRAQRNNLFDKIHKGAVLACLGVTIYGCVVLGLRAHKYFTVTKPQRKLMELEKNKELLTEGQESTEFSMQDTAQELKL